MVPMIPPPIMTTVPTDIVGLEPLAKSFGFGIPAALQVRSSVTAVYSMFDVPELEERAFQDAYLQSIADHADEAALQILRERGIEAGEQRVQEVVEMLNGQGSVRLLYY